MDAATRISLLFILCGKLHAKECNPTLTDQGNNETIYIDMIKTDGDTHLEIYFNGYISNQHFTNVFLYMKGNEKNISINSNYTGRIERIVNSNGQLSFMLLNVMFSDSGIYTIKRTPEVKETTCVLVSRRRVEATPWEPLIFSFIVDEKNTSFIRVEHPISKLNQYVVIYNATYNICTYIDFLSMEKKNIQKCVLNNGKFSYTIPEVGWLHKGSYFAWDDKGRLLDSIFLDIKGNATTESVETTKPLDIEKNTLAKETWFIISALGITMLSVFLVVVAVWEIRVRRGRMRTMDNSTSRREIMPIDERSNNAFIPEETRRVLTKQNSNDFSELTTNQFQPRFKLNNQNMCVRGLGSSKSSVNAKCNFQVDSSLSSAETIQSDSTHRYDYVDDIDELVSDCQSKQHYIRSNVLDTTSIGRKSQTSFEYSYIVQRRFMNLRPPAPEPVLKKKQNQQTIVANSFYSHKQVNKRYTRRYNPSILFAKKKYQGTIESHRTRSSDDLSVKCTNAVSSPSFVHLDTDLVMKDVDSRQKSRKVKWLKSKVVASMPEPYQFRDPKPGSASHCSRADYPGDDYDQVFTMERKHRRSWSSDALYGDRTFNTKASQSRRFSANSKPGSASQCSRADCHGDDYDHAYAMEWRRRKSWSNDALYGDQIFNTNATRSRRFSDNSKTGSASHCSRSAYHGDDYDQAYAMKRRHRKSWSSDALFVNRIFSTKSTKSSRFSANFKTGSASQCSRSDYHGDDYDQTYAMERKHRRSWSSDALYGDRIFHTKYQPLRRLSANSKPVSASQCSRSDYHGDDYDQTYAKERRHRRSWSNDALYGGRIFHTKYQPLRRLSASTCMDEDYYDCLNT